MFFEMLRKLVSLQHFNKLDGEDEGGIGRDVGAGATLTIGEVVGDVELEDGAFLHELHTFGPAGDDLAQAELGGLVAAVAGVEDGAVDESALIVAAHGVAGFGLTAGAFLDDLILEAAGGDGDAGALGVLFEESLAFAFGGFAAFGGLGLLALLELGEVVLEHLVDLAVAHLGLAALQHVGDGGGIVFNVKALLEAHSYQLVANVMA